MAALVSLKDQAAISKAAMASGHNVHSTIEIAVRSTDSSRRMTLDDRYIHEILFEISNAPRTITFLARRISARLMTTRDHVVMLKTLLLLHRLLRGGDCYFEQYLHNLWCSGEFKINLGWMVGNPDPMCSFMLSYSLFLGERMEWIINQAGKLEPNRASSVSGLQQSYEEKKAESVLYRLSKCQIFLNRVMDCLPSANTLMSSYMVIQSVMSIILRESFRVYDSFCEDIETILSSFFEYLTKPMRVLALDIFRMACIQTSSLRAYYEKCKKFMVGKRLDYPLVRIFTTAEVSRREDDCLNSPMSGKDVAVESHKVSLRSLFTHGLESKISTIWVEFD